MARSTPSLAALAAVLALLARPAVAQAPAAPDPNYRAGTVPTVGPDATNTNVGVTPSPVNPSGPTSNAGTSAAEPAASAASGTVGGFGPITTDNGVAATRPASAPRLSPETARAIEKARRVREPQRAASASGAASKR
jgi:hypothetical protein